MSALPEYLALARSHPALFSNPVQGGYLILLEPSEIQAAEVQQRERLRAEGLPEEWATVGIVCQDQYMLLVRDAVRYQNGLLGTYIRYLDVEASPPTVAILPLFHGEVLLIRHFRHATRDWHWELPCGGGEANTSDESSAHRELAEEISGVASRLHSLGHIHPALGMSAERIELFYADLESYGKVDPVEAIAEVKSVSIDEFRRMIREGEITDTVTIAAYTRAALLGLL
jgi:ADP-ribose pyrophosphatase